MEQKENKCFFSQYPSELCHYLATCSKANWANSWAWNSAELVSLCMTADELRFLETMHQILVTSNPYPGIFCKSGYHHLSPEAGGTPPCSTKKEALLGAARIFKKAGLAINSIFQVASTNLPICQLSLQMAVDWPGACPHLLPLLHNSIGPTLFPDKWSFLQAEEKHVDLPNSIQPGGMWLPIAVILLISFSCPARQQYFVFVIVGKTLM